MRTGTGSEIYAYVKVVKRWFRPRGVVGRFGRV